MSSLLLLYKGFLFFITRDLARVKAIFYLILEWGVIAWKFIWSAAENLRFLWLGFVFYTRTWVNWNYSIGFFWPKFRWLLPLKDRSRDILEDWRVGCYFWILWTLSLADFSQKYFVLYLLTFCPVWVVRARLEAIDIVASLLLRGLIPIFASTLGAGDNILLLLWLKVLLVIPWIFIFSYYFGANKLKGFFLFVDFLFVGLILDLLNYSGYLDLSSVLSHYFFLAVILFHLRSSGREVGISILWFFAYVFKKTKESLKVNLISFNSFYFLNSLNRSLFSNRSSTRQNKLQTICLIFKSYLIHFGARWVWATPL